MLGTKPTPPAIEQATLPAAVVDRQAIEAFLGHCIGWEVIPRRGVYDRIQRGTDLLIVLGSAPLTLPVLLLIALSVKLTSPGPVLFKQRRYGRGGWKFTLVKFRTMTVDAHETLYDHLDRDFDHADQWTRNRKLRNDPRVTWMGRWLRKLSLDELPQLWNVLKGEMSLVGPRPLPVCERHLYGPTFPVYCRVRPGLTGLWQVSGRSDLPYEQKALLDAEYVCRRGLWFDLRLILQTVGVVLRGRGAY
jgi:lipopolysaccharide/colanic/teichoic acid biosynthesis glycosyltransferase